MTMPANTEPAETERADGRDAEGPIRASEDAARLVDRMTEDLGLWRTSTQAALFLAAVGTAKDAGRVENSQLGDLTTVGHTDEIDGAREGLAVLGLVADGAASPGAVREDQLPGWIEAGADILEPRLARLDAAEATAEIEALLDEIGDAAQ